MGHRVHAAPDLTRTNLTDSVMAGDRTFQRTELNQSALEAPSLEHYNETAEVSGRLHDPAAVGTVIARNMSTCHLAPPNCEEARLRYA